MCDCDILHLDGGILGEEVILYCPMHKAAPDMLAALEEMINPPTIMEHDHPFEIAQWYVEKARKALASAAPMTSEQRQQVAEQRENMGEQDDG